MIDLLLNQIEKDSLESEINIQKTILTLRDQRSGMVQTEVSQHNTSCGCGCLS